MAVLPDAAASASLINELARRAANLHVRPATVIGRAWIRSAVIAVLLGIIWPFLLVKLFSFSGHLTVALIQAAAHLVSAESVRVVRGVNAVMWGLALGILFGIPLGLAVRTHVAAYWFAFVAALLITSATLALHSGVGLGILLLEWRLPET